MKKHLLLVLCSLALAACQVPEKEEPKAPQAIAEVPEKERETSVSGSVPDYQFSITDLQINQKINKLDLRAFESFGEFYTEDFVIYRLSRIDYLAEAYYIDDVNLYFIDSALVKIQAYLREDRSNDFISRYGRAKILISDYHNKKLLETEKVLVKVNGKSRINDNLSQYTLRWARKGLDIAYEVNKKADTLAVKGKEYSEMKMASGDQYRYKLTFSASDFKNRLAWIKWEAYKDSKGLD